MIVGRAHFGTVLESTGVDCVVKLLPLLAYAMQQGWDEEAERVEEQISALGFTVKHTEEVIMAVSPSKSFSLTTTRKRLDEIPGSRIPDVLTASGVQPSEVAGVELTKD